jgi:hypothetical protein
MSENSTEDHTEICKTSVGESVSDLREIWCFRCLESCKHAKGKGSFDQRTATWFQRLFQNRPLMDPSDPRYSSIAGKKFLPINPSGWNTPEEAERPLVVQVPAQIGGAFNTPVTPGGIYLPGGAPSAPATPKDPTSSWDAPPKKSPSNVVKPGAKIKMGQ